MFALRRIVNKHTAKSLSSACRGYSSIKKPLDFSVLKNESKVPMKPVTKPTEIPSETVTIDKPTLELLERLSLCNLSDKYEIGMISQ